jgi:hypothetical protein
LRKYYVHGELQLALKLNGKTDKHRKGESSSSYYWKAMTRKQILGWGNMVNE